jgi:hypothetical protein
MRGNIDGEEESRHCRIQQKEEHTVRIGHVLSTSLKITEYNSYLLLSCLYVLLYEIFITVAFIDKDLSSVIQ